MSIHKRSRVNHPEDWKRLTSFPHLDPNPILEVDFTGRVVYTNPAVSKVLRKLKVGVDPKAFLPEDLKTIINDRSAKRSGTSLFREVRIAEHVFNTHLIRVPGVDVFRIYAAQVRKKNNVHTQLLFEGHLLDSATDSIFVHDFNQRPIYVNEAAYRSRGYTKEEILKLKIKDLVAPDWQHLIDQRVGMLQKHGEDMTYDSLHVRKDGSVFQVEIHSRIIETFGKRYVLAVVRDVSHRNDKPSV